MVLHKLGYSPLIQLLRSDIDDGAFKCDRYLSFVSGLHLQSEEMACCLEGLDNEHSK